MQAVGAGIAGIITLSVMYRFLFRDKDELIECIKFWLTPDIISMFRGEYWDDHWAEFKLLIWVGTSTAVGYGVYLL